MKITEILVAEHRLFLRLFAQIERLLPRVRAAGEVRRLAALVEALLAEHGATETEVAYPALDHMLHDRGRLERLHQEHEEIDASLRAVQTAADAPEARRLLAAALERSRAHFLFEERELFPRLEDALQPETLAGLAAARAQREGGS